MSDLRVEKTERAIRNAFLELRSKMPVEKIKVRELCAKAEINKSTFYAHYKDIYDLSDTMETESVLSIIRSLPNTNSILEQPVEFTESLTLAFISQMNLTNILFSGNERSHMAEKIEIAIKAIIEENYPGFKDDIRMNILLTYCIHGSYNAVMNYKEYDLKVINDTIKEITATLLPLHKVGR